MDWAEGTGEVDGRGRMYHVVVADELARTLLAGWLAFQAIGGSIRAETRIALRRVG